MTEKNYMWRKSSGNRKIRRAEDVVSWKYANLR